MFGLEFDMDCMTLGPEEDEFEVGGRCGQFYVIDVHSGHKRRSPLPHNAVVTGVYVDRSTGETVSCSEDGRVSVHHCCALLYLAPIRDLRHRY